MKQTTFKLSKYTAIVFLLVINSAIQAQTSIKETSIEDKINILLKKMTLEEKVGQMNQYNGFWEVTGPAPKEGDAKNKYDHLRKGLVGAVLNVKGTRSEEHTSELQSQ